MGVARGRLSCHTVEPEAGDVCQEIRPRDTRRAAEAGPWRKAAGGSRIRDTHMEEIYVYIGS